MSRVLRKIMVWRSKNLNDRQFVLLLSAIVGIIVGFLAVGIKLGIHFLHGALTNAIHTSSHNFWFFLLPIVGISLSVIMVKYLYRGSFAHGITNVLYSISQQKSIVKIKNVIYFLFGSVLTVGFGGSVGMEATLVMTGSGVGSNVARWFRGSFSNRVLLLGCGAASALSCFFHAPIAGVIFALEVLMLDLTMNSLLPLLVASVIGAIIGKVFLGDDLVLDFSHHSSFVVEQLPYFLILGVLCALVSFYFSWTDRLTERLRRRLGEGWKKTIVLGGLAALMIFCLPPLFGEGYSAINQILSGQSSAMLHNSIFASFDEFHVHFLIFLAIVLVVKAIAVAFTLGAGGIGGYFAPSLFMGGITGFLLARLVNMMGFFGVRLSEDNFTLVGMAGVMSGVFYAPLTAVFLIAEITRGYDLIVPLMLVSATSYLIIHYLEPHSLFTRRLAKRGELITHHKDRAALSMLSMKGIVENDFKATHPHATLREFLKDAVAQSKRNIFPVLDDEGKLVSIVLLDDARPFIFKQEMFDQLTVSELMRQPPALILATDSMQQIVQKFDRTSAWNLPVVDQEGHYVGFISKSKLLSAYRDVLVTLSMD